MPDEWKKSETLKNPVVEVIDHPLIQHKMAILRHRETGPKDFRDLVEEISTLLAYEATRNLPLEETQVETPLGICSCRMIAGKKLGLIPILRAGLGMVNGILRLIPAAKVGHIGIYRDHSTLQPIVYYSKLPVDLSERQIFVLDPMLATAGSAIEAIRHVKEKGGKEIAFLCLIASQVGLEALTRAHPDVRVLVASIDQTLNSKGYIVPGLGDAGDRLFGTQ
jgi:uracil phosphoribosyltransferase